MTESSPMTVRVPSLRRGFALGSVLALLLSLSSVGASQEEAPPAPGVAADEGYILEEEWEPQLRGYDPAGGYFYFLGNVAVRVGELRIRCDNLIAWPKKGLISGTTFGGESGAGAERSRSGGGARYVSEIYADGAVFIRRGSEWTKASQIYLDLENERGIVIEAAAGYPLDSRRGAFRVNITAEELRLLSRTQAEAIDATLTTDPFATPQYQVVARRIRLVKRDGLYSPDKTDPNRPESIQYKTEDAVLEAGGVPLIPFPDVLGETTSGGNSFRWFDSASYRKSNRFGHEFDLLLGDDIELDDGTKWGHWNVLLTYLTNRGVGAGFGLDYGTADYEGSFLGRYQRDRGSDRIYGEPPGNDRGRLSWQHRHQLPENVQLDLELNLFSDRGFYPEYYEDEFKEAKPPENLIYLKRDGFNSQFSATLSGRFNNWLDVTERKPEVRYDLITEPLFEMFGEPLYFTTSARVGNLTLARDKDLGIPRRDSVRVDLDTQLEYPIPIGPLTLTPFTGVRYTYFENDLRSNDRSRVGYTFGASLATQAWRTFDAEGGIFGLDGLRHIVRPVLTFRNTVGVDPTPDELIQFDRVDLYDNVQALEFRVRNLLQTRREIRGRRDVDTFFDLETAITYFPNADRDNFGESFSTLDVDLLLRFSDTVQFASDFEVDWYGAGFEVFNAAIGLFPARDLQAFVGFRHFDDTYDAVFGQLNWRIEEKWRVSLDTAYDFRDGRGLDHRLALARIGRNFVFEFNVRADIGENDFGFGVAFYPRLLFDGGARPRGLGREPRFLLLDDRLRH